MRVKRLLSLTVVLALLLCVVPSLVLAAEEDGPITLYFAAPGWNEAYAVLSFGEGSESRTVPMSKVDDRFLCSVPADAISLYFNNGSDDTRTEVIKPIEDGAIWELTGDYTDSFDGIIYGLRLAQVQITFLVDGEEIWIVSINKGSILPEEELPPAPTKEGYVFAGWTLNGEDPLELEKARVASFRAGFGLMARSLAAIQNLDYELITTASMVNLFTAGAVDATLAMSFDEYYKLLQTGLISPDRGIYRFEEGEYNIQEDGVYVTRAFYEAHREACEGFARASRRGWEWVSEHREEALDLVMRYVKEHRIATNRTLQQLMLDEVLRLQQDRDSGAREFRLRRDMVEKANDTMLRAGVLIGPVTYEELMP